MSQGEERRKEKEEGRGEEGVAGCCAPMTSFFSRWRRKKLFLCRARPRHVRQFSSALDVSRGGGDFLTSGKKEKWSWANTWNARGSTFASTFGKERGNNGLLAYTMGGEWALLQVLLWRESRKDWRGMRRFK